VVRFDPKLKVDAPYQSWGTEYVFVAEDRPDFVALQHILVTRVLMEGGVVSEPFVVRHWRQEWRYQAETLLAYEGANAWARRAVPAAERSGAWVQSVLQVDDSPRYAARGRWKHEGGVSTWLSDETWRPLPRREFSVRKDYEVLVGTNRHTITPQGWLQEENNLKLVLADRRHARRAFTLSLSSFPSMVLPASFDCAAFMTAPICFADVAPVSEIAASIAACMSSSDAPAGR